MGTTDNSSLDLLTEPQAVEDLGSDLVEVGDEAPSTSGFQPRRSVRETAGKRSNVYHLPVGTRTRAHGAAVSQVPGSSNMTLAAFRPWV